LKLLKNNLIILYIYTLKKDNMSFKTNASALASIAGNRRKLYDLIQKKYDLPNFSPCITETYL